MRKVLATEIEIETEEAAVTLKVVTKAPTKYLLVDTETGQVYRGNSAESYMHTGYYWRNIQEDIDTFLLKDFIADVHWIPKEK